jgi:hypothetical protein
MNMKRTLVLPTVTLLYALALAGTPLHGQGPSQKQGDKFLRAERRIANEYIVVLSDDIPAAQVAQVAESIARPHGGSIKFLYTSALRGFSVRLPEAAAVAISQSQLVKYVEENPQGSIDATELNPPWGLDRIDQRDGRDNIYTYNATGAGVNAYVIDTGIRTSHVDFGGRASLAAIFVNDGCSDCNGHGTHVAGTIGGSTYGVAKAATLRGVKVCDSYGNCPGDATIAGVDWVKNYHVKPAVANMSLRFFGDFVTLNNAVRSSINAGVTYAVAAGNENDDANNYSPARVTEALTVGATDISDTRAWFSNYGSVVDLFAPGVDILSAGIGSDTDAVYNTGTSMASPHVAGVAALFLQSNPGASPAAVSSALVGNATLGRVFDPGPGSPNRLLYSIFAPPPASTGQPVPKDYDGDGKVDISVKTDDGRWRIDYASNGFGTWDATYSGYGGSGSTPVPTDYDGDGRADLSTKSDNGAWSIDYASNGFGAFDVTYTGYGLGESRPAPADYDGDGRADLSIHSTSTANWRIDYAYNGYGYWDQTLYGYGYSENREAPADYDGDGRDDVGVHSTTLTVWAIDYARTGLGSWDLSRGGYGYAVNREAPADYDGDGRADIAIKADDQGRFNIDYAWNGFGVWDASYTGYGFAETRPAPGDYDGDGRADFAVMTDDGRWRIDYAANGFGAFDQTITPAASGSNSLSLDGINDYVLVNDSDSLSVEGPITVEAWFKVNSIGTYQTIVAKESYTVAGSGGGYELQITNTGKVRANFYQSHNTYTVAVGTTTVTPGVWHHAAATFDGTTRRVFLDGSLEVSITDAGGGPTTGSGNLRIGRRNHSTNTYYFGGLIDEVRVSNTALYSTGFTPQTRLTVGPSTKGLWKLNQTADDASGNGNNGTLQGGAGFSTDVP